ncbi:MAG TPA: pyridoxamine 5'-phosphate oxidase family protein [Candidatus Dormibacteraeota bacterium]|nr:pyridoxamine 5'-phosphate oxidase family protein [Candidatus Dormibacteraeota bacterium]
MRLDPEQREVIAAARIGMLAVAGRLPLVNPAAFHFGGGALWMTTSRHAAKLALARRDPRAAFLAQPAGRSSHGVLLQGMLEAYDPRSPSSQLRALALGPRLALSLAGYTLKNAAFIGGYVLDLARIPAEWWPHNRVLLRMVPDRVSLVPPLDAPPAATARVPGLPAQVALRVARQRAGQLCWPVAGRPVLTSAAWTIEGRDALAWLPADGPRPAGRGLPGALLIENHHQFRATRMVGCCLRGRLAPDPGAREALAARYGRELPEGGTAVRLAAARVTWWRGFEVRSRDLERPAEATQAEAVAR